VTCGCQLEKQVAIYAFPCHRNGARFVLSVLSERRGWVRVAMFLIASSFRVTGAQPDEETR
jgi:hypothetical protein